jgi:hypothetical protein
MCLCVFVCVCVWVFVCVFVCVYVCVCVFVCGMGKMSVAQNVREIFRRKLINSNHIVK